MHERHDRHESPSTRDHAWLGELSVGETGDITRLHALSGVDAGDWRICGVDIRFSYGEPTGAGVFAVERTRFAEADHDWERLAADHDDVVPVTEFALPAARAVEILELFPDLSLVAARAPATKGDGVELRVVDRVMPALMPTD